MIIPVGDEEQQMKKIVKTSETTYTETVVGKAHFVPMLSGKAK